MIAFKLIDEGENPPPTYQEIRCHIIFYINMEDFRRKDRYVAGVHETVAPPTVTYASVVSQVQCLNCYHACCIDLLCNTISPKMIPILFVESQRFNDCLWYSNTKLDIFLY